MKKNLLNKTIAFSLAVLFTAIACACGVPVDEPAQSTASLVLPTATPAPRPVSGGEVRMPMPVNADVSDPLAVTSEELLALFSLIYESVLGILFLASLKTGRVMRRGACGHFGCAQRQGGTIRALP